jgi:hypothetical protein
MIAYTEMGGDEVCLRRDFKCETTKLHNILDVGKIKE